jgi:hypothetical protein
VEFVLQLLLFVSSGMVFLFCSCCCSLAQV